MFINPHRLTGNRFNSDHLSWRVFDIPFLADDFVPDDVRNLHGGRDFDSRFACAVVQINNIILLALPQPLKMDQSFVVHVAIQACAEFNSSLQTQE